MRSASTIFVKELDRLFDGIRAGLVRLLELGPGILAFDDLQHAPVPVLQLVPHVAALAVELVRRPEAGGEHLDGEVGVELAPRVAGRLSPTATPKASKSVARAPCVYASAQHRPRLCGRRRRVRRPRRPFFLLAVASRDRPSDSIRPSRNRITRSAYSAMSGSCVTIRMVIP